MNKHFILKVVFVIAPLLAMPPVLAANISKVEYKAGKTRISSEYDTDKAACKSLAGNVKSVCVEEAKAKQNVARAKLEFSYSGKPADQTKVLEVKAKSAYAVAKEKCNSKTGNEKNLCVEEAKTTRTKALADAKMSKQIGEAKKESAEDKSDANYNVAVEKCNAMAGNAKSDCIAAAKAKFGKN